MRVWIIDLQYLCIPLFFFGLMLWARKPRSGDGD